MNDEEIRPDIRSTAPKTTPKHDEDDDTYFRRRATWHQDQADRATDGHSRALHQKFVSLYHARIRPRLVHSSQ